MMITIDPRALLTTILIIVTIYFTARDYLLRLTIMSIVVWLIILFRIHQEIPTRMVVSLMDVFWSLSLAQSLLFCILCIVLQGNTKRKSA